MTGGKKRASKPRKPTRLQVEKKKVREEIKTAKARLRAAVADGKSLGIGRRKKH